MDTEILGFFTPDFLWARYPELQDCCAWPQPQNCYHRFADAIPRFTKTGGQLFSTMDEIVDGALPATVVADEQQVVVAAAKLGCSPIVANSHIKDTKIRFSVRVHARIEKRNCLTMKFAKQSNPYCTCKYYGKS